MDWRLPRRRCARPIHEWRSSWTRIPTLDPDAVLDGWPFATKGGDNSVSSFGVGEEGKPNRVATMVTVSPDEQFLIVGTTFDQPVEANPDGSPILLVREDRREAETYCFEQPSSRGPHRVPRRGARHARRGVVPGRWSSFSMVPTLPAQPRRHLSSSDTRWATAWHWRPSTQTARSARARLSASTPAAACQPSCAGGRGPPA